MITILNTLVGSRAQNLYTADSDYDWRSVHITPTAEMLSIGYNGKRTISGDNDYVSYEIGHFLHLCTKANPTTLEVLLSTQHTTNTLLAEQMRELLPYMFSPDEAFGSFRGFANAIDKRLMHQVEVSKTRKVPMQRAAKNAVVRVRVLSQLCELLETGTFSVEIKDHDLRHALTILRQTIETSSGNWMCSYQVLCKHYESAAEKLLESAKDTKDLAAVNAFLLKTRYENFNCP